MQPYRPRGESQSIVHNLWHAFVFGVAALLLMALANGRKREWIGAASVFGLALGIEIAQYLLYKGRFEWWDVRDDTIGLLIAMLLIRRTRVRSLLIANGG